MNFKKTFAILSAAAALVSFSAQATPVNLVQNGGFETMTNGIGQINTASPTKAVGWTTNGYNFVFNGATASTVGSKRSDGTALTLWGTSGLTSSPNGGNFLGADGVYQQDWISQTITGLTIGQQYDLTFYWAGAQQSGFSGITTENWTAKLGTESYTTVSVTDQSHASTPWVQQTFTYTATGTTETLAFLAGGTPAGEPPFSLLDGVSLTAHTANVPEPSSWALIVTGLVLLGAALRFRRRGRSA